MDIKTIIKPRQGGKTTDLLKMSAETGYPIVAKNREDGRSMKKRAKELGLCIPEPVTINQVMKRDVNIYADHVLIDDAEYFINQIVMKLAGYQVAGLTMTTRNEKGHEVTIYGEDLNDTLKSMEDQEEDK